ncbi:hypothetical protein ACJIZ3_016076 [Penstemon smallii]|uniref:Uncharacterized protein n=1 Tax=Penstemon smallii TaxID=265156 RepID=A0ABD3RPI0_9LAMI
MVSLYPNPPPLGQEFSHFLSYYSTADQMKINNNNNLIDWNSDDPNKKVRKPYTITKSRESWSEQEHDKFIEALQLFDRDWKKIEAFIGSKTVIQIRSHAQKYFLKVQKNGTCEHLPPPRPKRKAAHPYPQKAPKNGPLQSPAAQLESGYVVRSDAMPIPRNPVSSAHTSSPWTQNYSSSSNESTPPVCTSNIPNGQVNTTRVMPDFSQVYGFIGSVFDPSAGEHLQRLKKMDPIDVETVLMLMKNLCVNLTSPEFENHRRLLLSHNAGIEKHGIESTIPSV